MHRNITVYLLALAAAGVLISTPAQAGDEDALRERVKQLENQVDALQQRQTVRLEDSIEEYLDRSSAWKAADGDNGMDQITITAALTANSQNSLDQVNNRSLITGDLDLGFHFQVAENLAIHATMVAASGGPAINQPNTALTLSGADDGVGVNSNSSVTGNGRGINIWEAYFVHTVKMGGGESSFHWEAGALDPRLRFLQNTFANNENTQFSNNLFSDPSSWLWQTQTTGASVLGLHMWFSFGKDGMHTVNFGYFNPVGQWWNNGWFAIQYTAKLNVSGREMNIRVAFNFDGVNQDVSGDATFAWGISWDWWATDKIGVFARINGGDDSAINAVGVNAGGARTVELDWSLGGEFHIIASRPDDYFGVAIGQNVINTTAFPGADDELVLEIYYLYAVENGKMQITPYLMYVASPGGSTVAKDLYVLGVRIHVPF